jgi:hypothetical protein
VPNPGVAGSGSATERIRRPRADEAPTPSGIQVRDAIETATDRLAAPLVSNLGDRAVELVDAMRPLAERIMATGEVPKRNNMGLPWPYQ